MSRHLFVALCMSALGCGAPNDSDSRVGQGTLLLRNAVLVDVVTGERRPGTSVLISNGRIAGMGPNSAFSDTEGLEVIDATGRYLMPGFIDSHVHLFPTWGNNWPDSIAELGWVLASGVTTIREAGGGGNRARLQESYLQLRNKADSGLIDAPHIVVSAQDYSLMRVTGAGTLEEAFSRWTEAGFDQYKIMELPREAALEQIRLAREAGVPIWGHHAYWPNATQKDEFAGAAAEAGINGLTHGPGGLRDGLHEYPLRAGVSWDSPAEVRALAGLEEQLDQSGDDANWSQQIVGRGAWFEPTLAVSFAGNPLFYGRCTNPVDLDRIRIYYPYYSATEPLPLTEEQVTKVRQACERRFQLIRLFAEAGGKILAGTDEVPFAPLGVQWSMNLLVLAGLSPLVALQAATVNSAEALGLGDQVGTIEVGKYADLVLLDGDPLDDIENVYRVSTVLARGRVIDRAALLARHGTSPPMRSPREIDNSHKLATSVERLAREHPDSAATFAVVVNGLYRPADFSGVERWIPVTLVAQRGDTLLVNGPASVMPQMTGFRFVQDVRMR